MCPPTSTRRSSSIRAGRSVPRSSSEVARAARASWGASGLVSRSTSSARSSAFRPASSRTSCVSHPDGLPDLFLDRSLGRIKVPRLLRAAGLRLVTLSEHYTIPADEDVADDEWLELAGSRGWAVLMKDTRI